MPRRRPTTPSLATLLVLTCSAADPTTAPGDRPEAPRVDPFTFLDGYRIAHYLDAAAKLQALAPDERAARLRHLALDPTRGSEVYPLCRMLFEATPGGEFRRPGIGAAHFIDGGRYEDWPLEPITLHQGVPILIVDAYTLAGYAERPDSYLEYCLTQCKWRDTTYATLRPDHGEAAVRDLIASRPKLGEHTQWLLRQAE
jgi:hypothetical protein